MFSPEGMHLMLHSNFEKVGTWEADADGLRISLTTGQELEECVYSFTDELGQPVRLGTSKGPLRGRMRSFERDLTKAINGLDHRGNCAEWEPAAWCEVGKGSIYAVVPEEVTVAGVTVRPYLNVEGALIRHYKSVGLAQLNRSYR